VDFEERLKPNTSVIGVAPDQDGTIVRWHNLTILDTQAMHWAQSEDGPFVKELWTDPGVALLHISLEAGPSTLPYNSTLLLAGSLLVGTNELRAGVYVERGLDAPDGWTPGPAGATSSTGKRRRIDRGGIGAACPNARTRSHGGPPPTDQAGADGLRADLGRGPRVGAELDRSA
jgi:hypothetical protein